MYIHLNKVSFEGSQGAERISILKQIDLQIDQGESVAIVGKSGSGKSTLLSLLAGFQEVNSGEISIDGKPPGNQGFGFIFQDFNLLPGLNALQNVQMPLVINDIPLGDKAEQALESVGMSHRQKHFPKTLSGGESQRVAIARALVAEPTLLLADEPTGNLDNEMGEVIEDLLLSLVKKLNLTLVLVTHDLQFAKRCDRSVLLQDGQLT